MAIKKSPIDDLYYNLYGYHLPKAGQAYERIVAAAFKLLLNKDIEYDQMLRGDYSKTVYQLDGRVNTEENNNMIEAKDYTIESKKVGRGDIQKMQGALSDLPLNAGFFASATDYTLPAKKYAASSNVNPMHKPIELYNIRPSTEEDEAGRLKKLVINVISHNMDYQNAKYQALFTKDAKQKLLENGYAGKTISHSIDRFLKSDGSTLITVHDLSFQNPPGTTWEDGFVSKGCWIIKGGHLMVDQMLYGIEGLEYEVPFLISESELVIESEGKAMLFVKSENGKINKLIYDGDLRKLKFENGRVLFS